MAFLPLFPLNLVAFPGEKLNLHIFEPRYIQLITECLEADTPFGIPVYIPNQRMDFGTSLRVLEVSQRYDDGRMDIRTEALQIFRLLSFINPVERKLYAGGQVTYHNHESSTELLPGLLDHLKKLYQHLQTNVDFNDRSENFSYQIAHKIGLSLEEEYELLQIPQELERQRFISRHLNRIMPVIQELEKTKERIRLNGHFRNFDPLNF
ncbi:LON peptidase substrate-binding domain-containing protein [Siphonobacter curvatus]|uniref:Peptidase n=1 Tax=Siphonobacter curvatus TaxID=2094562 RepID=A0A2S7IKS0_9BACT|nr:LON peptidase substrate-binding domain-containing protein [Siphonobacter curvatus]PQA58160.1 peptidase [Siphonobacter curvatus]